MKNKSTSLSYTFTHMYRLIASTYKAIKKIMYSTIKFLVQAKLQRYIDSHYCGKNEMRYDAYMIGFIFSQACKPFNIDYNNLHL